MPTARELARERMTPAQVIRWGIRELRRVPGVMVAKMRQFPSPRVNVVGWVRDDLWPWVRGWTDTVEHFVLGPLFLIAEGAWEWIDEWADKLPGVLGWVGRFMTDTAPEVMRGAVGRARVWFDRARSWVSNTALPAFRRSIGGVIDAARRLASAARDLAGRAWSWVATTGAELGRWIAGAGATVWRWVRDAGATVWGWVQTAGETVWRWVRDAGAALWRWYQEVGEALFRFARDLLPGLWRFLSDPAGHIGRWALDALRVATTAMLGLMINALVGAWETAEGWIARLLVGD